MKVRFIAVLLSLVVATLSVYADSIVKKPIEVTHSAPAASKIDLNKATVESLTGSIKGIGKKRAEAIIAYREAHQGFKSIEELAEVKGLGQRFLKANREMVNQVFVVNEVK